MPPADVPLTRDRILAAAEGLQPPIRPGQGDRSGRGPGTGSAWERGQVGMALK
jgi:hypothetical protein